MVSYATIPAEAEAEKPLLNRDLRVNLKTVIGGAAVASFVLGALAAAVVSGAPARTNSAALYAHSGYQPSAHAPMAFHAGKKNGESCKKDAECRSGDCHKGDGPYMKLYSCKDSDNQHFAYDEFSKKFALDFDYEDDVDQLCMGWDQLEDSSRVIATRCYEDRDPYDAQIYWKIL